MRTRRMRAAAGLVVASLIVVACGSRRPHDEIVAAAGGASSGSQDQLVPGHDGFATGSDDGTTDDGSAAGGDGSGDGSSNGDGASADGASTGSDGTANGTTDGSGGSASGSRIRVGVVGTLSGPAGASLKPVADGVRIWAKAVNARGGVNGHPIDVLTADDGGDPARHLALVQEFVERKKVIAFVGNPEAVSGQSSVTYLKEHGVPVIGSEGAGQYFYESPVHFPQASHGNALAQAALLGVANVAKQRKLTRVATITCIEVQVCRDAYENAPRGYGKYGLEVVYRAQASLGQPDFTAECLQAQNQGAQIMAMGMDAGSVIKIARACRQQGFRPLFTWTTAITTSAHAEDPNLQGSLISSVVAPWASPDTERRKEFLDAMATYARGVTVTGGHLMGWVAGKVFELGGKGLPEPATSRALLDGLGRLNGDLLPDLTAPFRFSLGKPAKPTVCVFNVFVRDKTFKSGGARSCTAFDPTL